MCIITDRLLANSTSLDVQITMLNRQKMFTSNMLERMRINNQIKTLQAWKELPIINKQAVKAAIAACKGGYKWDKSSYVYAMHAMYPYGYYDAYKKAELIEKFYEAIETKFRSIAGFTTFKNVNCYL